MDRLARGPANPRITSTLSDLNLSPQMKSIKVILAAVALSLLATGSAQAQEKKGKQTPEQQIERIETSVGSLTADQKAKIKDIIAKANEAMQGVPKEERKQKSGAINKKRTEDIRAVLTPEQRKKYDDAMASMKKKN